MQRRPVYARVLGWIARYGIQLVLCSRFIYGCRIAIPVACGATGMPPGRFTAGDITGAIIWSAIVSIAGYAMGEALEYVFADLRRYEWWIAGVLVAIARWRRLARRLDTVTTSRSVKR